MVIRKSIEWSKDSQFQCAKQLAREKELWLCLLQSKQVLIFIKRSLMIELLSKYPIDLKCKYKFKQTSLFLVFDCGAHLAQKDL